MTDRLRRLDALEGECQPWPHAKNERGYGLCTEGGKTRRAHQVAYEAAHGPVPAGLEIDHICRNRSCVNPNHLRAVSHRENVLCGTSFAAVNATKTHCVRGHPYSDENTYREGTRRDCRICRRNRSREWWRRNRLACLRAVGVSEEELA